MSDLYSPTGAWFILFGEAWRAIFVFSRKEFICKGKNCRAITLATAIIMQPATNKENLRQPADQKIRLLKNFKIFLRLSFISNKFDSGNSYIVEFFNF